MAIFAAVSEGKARRIGEPARRAMDNFGDQCERLQRARAKVFQEQQFGELAQVALISNGEHGAETFQIDVLRPHLVMTRHLEVACRV